MTIIMNNGNGLQTLLTKPPTFADALFLEHMRTAWQIWENDGRPNSQ